MEQDLKLEWKAAQAKMEELFGPGLDVQGILFLIGVQELGKGRKKFSKDQKLEVMHVAICTLLAPYGYYEFAGNDEEGWPHFNATAKLPHLKPMQQEDLMKQAIVEYVRKLND
ncbi:MAG TPA: hypothetical protein VNZ86_07675 [Bacteroidia bacterium]|jgi:hypothetical protein|nr:hypothetical protein [Bacteroidia bacterium]